ncbi:unnamed protein product [Bursaphelenchus xylophilus]|uniref:non-specific serine/threonine protein kinase n=1 Tax=Bursaphelenchus xylophilus TaxID=6326 RepID=A0A1I7RI94_BURXY|nr:unnamed protein product [Bursaphelenchus xylophilus]CAG9115068.1 unnamed protein product [Bursaphelenchus xylophilus]
MVGKNTYTLPVTDGRLFSRLDNKKRVVPQAASFQHSAFQSAKKPQISYPNRIDGYQIISNLGSGAFAKVYLAKNHNHKLDTRMKEMVALKVVNLTKITEASQLKSTKKEYQITSKVKHPNIVEIYNSFEQPLNGSLSLILVVEYMSQGTLEQYLHHNLLVEYKLLPEYRIWHIFQQVACGIAFMHSCRCLHRDLKPANILMADNFLVKISDFGLSRMNSINTEEVKTVCGTPYYLSPERTLQSGYTYASDVWSLGCLLYELTAGVNPFFGERDNRYSLSNKITEADFPPVPEDHYSYFLLNLIDKILVTEQTERPPASFISEYSEHMVEFFRRYVNF